MQTVDSLDAALETREGGMKSIEVYTLAQGLEAAFNKFGRSTMSDDFAAKLLAFVFVMGGGNEAVTTHPGLVFGIATAQKKFKLCGGETPDAKGMELIKSRVAELMTGLKENYSIAWNSVPWNSVPWLKEISERYGLNNELRLHKSKHGQTNRRKSAL